MKKTPALIALTCMVGFTAVAVVASSIAWFANIAVISNSIDPLEGKTQGAYFAYGDGTEENPFGITKPRHLYNLSWLNYINHFNKNVDGNGQIIPTYFELGSDVSGLIDDQTGEKMAIPPIGDASHPFVGQFNGNGYVISNFIITNDSSDFQTKPAAVSSYNQSEIVGLFGVVGKLASDVSTSYDTSTNTISNFGITDVEIRSTTSHTLAGIAAGYVNGEISGVAINNSGINIEQANATAVTNIGTTNLSDYGAVGFCTEQYKSTITQYENEVYGLTVSTKEFVAKDEGDTNGWGGSINMTDMYNRLLSMKNTHGSTTGTYAYNITVAHYPDDTTTTTNNRTNTNSFKQYNTDPKVGVYQIGNRTDTNAYMYLNGGQFVTNEHYVYNDHTGYPITNGSYYLNVYLNENNAALLTNGNSVSTCTLWSIPTGNNTTGRISMEDSTGTTQYLTSVNNNLSLTTTRNSATTWTITRSGGILTIRTGNYHLIYDDEDGWLLRDFSKTSETYYTIVDDSGHYFYPGSTTYLLKATSVESDGIRWFYDSTYSAYYYLRDGQPRYLMYNGGYAIANASYNNSSPYFTLYSGNITGTSTLKARSNNYYVKYNNSNDNGWGTVTNRNQGTSMTITAHTETFNLTDNIVDSAQINRPGPDSSIDNSQTTSGMEYGPNNTTYFPLNVVKDGSQTTISNYYPKETNTGYVVTGSSYVSNYTWANDDNTYFRKSNMRVSQYAISNISASYSGGNLSNIYTINSSNTIVRITDPTVYEKYTDSRSSLQTILSKDNSNVYGLHFMDAQISASAKVSAKYVMVNGVEHTNYELPVNSIDFSLKEKGYINFFAGMYFPGNDSLFSLHHIQRNGDGTIAKIKEIAEVYSDGIENHSYVYKYKDNKYSNAYSFNATGNKESLSGGTYVESTEETSIPSGYSSVFNTTRITNYNNGSRVNSNFYWPTGGNDKTITVNGSSVVMNKAIYYFEIPMNEGEFCLGSVSGGTGGYLFYLDIAANAKKLNRTKFTEHFKETKTTFDYPKGVAFTTVTTGSITVDEGHSGYIAILPSYNNEMSIAYSESGSTNEIKVTGASNLTQGRYKYEKMLLHYATDPPGTTNPNELIMQYQEQTVTEIWRHEYLDFNSARNELTRTIITEEIIDGVAQPRTVVQYDNNGNQVAASNVVVYDENTERRVYDLSLINIDKTGTDTNDVILQFSFTEFDGTVVNDITYVLSYARIGETTYYLANGYTVTVVLDSGSVELITVTNPDGNSHYSGITVTVNGNVITISGFSISA